MVARALLLSSAGLAPMRVQTGGLGTEVRVGKNENFFEAAKPAATLKHGILHRYVRPYVQKVGSTSKGGRVAYIDGYAGPGVYDDGALGSPAVAVDIAKEIVDQAGTTRIDGYFVERETASVDALRALFLKSHMPWTVFEGDVQAHLPSIVKTVHADTAFVLSVS